MTARADSSSGKPADQPAPSVSVVLPTRQRRELVRRAVASVFAQTFTGWELLVVDDGSTDGTRDALAAVRDPRLRYRWQPHRGVSAARNAALGRARGEIVAFLDSDDVWLPHHLAAVTELLRGHPEAVLATTCGRYALGAGRRGGLPRLLDPLPEHLYAHLAGYPSCVAVRRAPVMECGGFDERQLVGEDADLFLRLALRGPFVIARRRTSVKQHTPGLKDWGRRRGLYLDAAELMPRRAIEELRRLPGARSAELERDAEGALHFAAALRGLQARDERSVRIALAQACRALPGLSRRGELVLERLEILPGAHVPDERLAHLTLVATCWPDPRADAALMARWCALLAALRRARLTHAAQLIAGWPLRPTPGALRRARPALAQRAHRRLDAWRYRSRRRVDRAWRATGARPRASVARRTGRTSN